MNSNDMTWVEAQSAIPVDQNGDGVIRLLLCIYWGDRNIEIITGTLNLDAMSRNYLHFSPDNSRHWFHYEHLLAWAEITIPDWVG